MSVLELGFMLISLKPLHGVNRSIMVAVTWLLGVGPRLVFAYASTSAQASTTELGAAENCKDIWH